MNEVRGVCGMVCDGAERVLSLLQCEADGEASSQTKRTQNSKRRKTSLRPLHLRVADLFNDGRPLSEGFVRKP